MQITLREVLDFELFEPFRSVPHKLKNLLDDSQILKYRKGAIIINEGDDDGGREEQPQFDPILVRIVEGQGAPRPRRRAEQHEERYTRLQPAQHP